jgi:hypothetical protein
LHGIASLIQQAVEKIIRSEKISGSDFRCPTIIDAQAAGGRRSGCRSGLSKLAQ